MAEERPSHDQEFVEYVVKSIVDHPDDVNVDRTIDEMGVLITLTVNTEDMGQVIGRQGATAKSVRTLLRVIGAKNNARVNLKINEPEGSERGSETKPAATQEASANKDEVKDDTTEEVKEEVKEPAEEIKEPAEEVKEPAEKATKSVEDAIDDLNI